MFFSPRWNLMLVFPPHFDRNGSCMTHCLEKKGNKESEKLCGITIVDSMRNCPASVTSIFVFID